MLNGPSLRDKLRGKKFVVTLEIAPPKGVESSKVMEEVRMNAPFVDAMNATELQRSIMRVGSLAMSKLLWEAGVEPIMQMTCGHKNRIALQSEMLSAACLGIRNILVLGGDPPNVGDHPDAKGVYDLDAVTLLEAGKKLKSGVDLAGNEIQGVPDLFLGGAATPGAPDLDAEISKMEKKIEVGCEFFQTQAFYDLDLFGRFMKKANRFKTPILAGIIPIKSGKMAAFLNKIPGIQVPDSLVQEIDEAKDKEEVSVQMTARLIRGIRDLAQGIHLMPIGWGHLVERILEASGLHSERNIESSKSTP